MTPSLIVLLSPISRKVFSSLYFLSCGSPPILEKEKNLLFFPIVVGPSITTWEPMDVPDSISTSGPIIEKGPTFTFESNFADLSIIADLCIII